jgi:hypothetical protein
LFDRGDYSAGDSLVQRGLSLIEELGDSAAAVGVHLFIVNLPENPLYATTTYRDTLWIGRLGPSRLTYEKIVARIDSLVRRNRFVHFYDANNFGNHDYTDGEAQNCNHLNFRGAVKFTARLDSLVRLYAGGR